MSPGANAALSPTQLDAAAPAFERADICLLQLETPLPTVSYAIQLAPDQGLRVILNPAFAQALPSDLLSGLFLLTRNESEAQLLTGIAPDRTRMPGRQQHSSGKRV